ncbi:hypothetical protein B9Z19DRAFT_1135728 [Tuber borchii]|uniref:Uncharacterized protein n=1 Tax=Tuber borchii TaxID=42251 RepID=A0A2T6ZCG4_TUBBO|nr:hypothetical protein B9Z19DRAFT_1135728 [Tuber borchii]
MPQPPPGANPWIEIKVKSKKASETKEKTTQKLKEDAARCKQTLGIAPIAPIVPITPITPLPPPLSSAPSSIASCTDTSHPGGGSPWKSHHWDILSCISAHIRLLLPHSSARNQFPGVGLEPNNPTIIAQNSPLPAVVGPRKGPSAPCMVLHIILLIRVTFWLSVELGDVKLAWEEIVPAVPNKRCIGTNRVPTIRRGNSCSVDEAGDSKGGALRETKPGIDQIVVDQFHLVGAIGSDIRP